MKNFTYFRNSQWSLLALMLAGIMVVIASAVRLPLSPYLDFRVLYFADKGILEGVSLYDPQGQAEMMARFLNTTAEHVSVIPFPYFPWLALGTLYLGLFPIGAAMTFWVELNVVMLFFSVLLLTDDWHWRARLLAFPVVFLFLPVMGTLAVGQYDFPILLGMSMLIHGLRREKVFMSAAGAWLAVIKPHLGAFVFLFALVYLVQRKTEFSRRTLYAILFLGAGLCLSGFAADPAWLVSYPKSLLIYREQSHIASCSECASLPVILLRLLAGISSLERAAWISIPILVIFFAAFFFIRSGFESRPHFLLSVALLATLSSSPYFYNYDFILLLIPFSIFAESEERAVRILTWACLLIPTVAIALYGRDGNAALLVVTIAAACILYRHAARLAVNASAE